MSNIKEEVVNELHKPARKKFKLRHVIVKGLNDLIQIDLVMSRDLNVLPAKICIDDFLENFAWKMIETESIDKKRLKTEGRESRGIKQALKTFKHLHSGGVKGVLNHILNQN
ncbi:hypothetical protein NQ315_006046 [Exocentrus adspersus]|uniref:Uncharacterized protein n=1 Tax=Exocentrus adspersus TaxID=1586481 RepID=A0AAV8VG28_9CUCU|nr:hypothetical protein NQ315_006046 [Exocentrus adspersus]